MLLDTDICTQTGMSARIPFMYRKPTKQMPHNSCLLGAYQTIHDTTTSDSITSITSAADVSNNFDTIQGHI